MTKSNSCALKGHYSVTVPEPDDFMYWRDQARHLIQCGIPPERVSWTDGQSSGDLFSSGNDVLPPIPDSEPTVRSSRRFMSLARNAALHSDPERFALLYALLWRLQKAPRLMEDKTDGDVRRVELLDKSVRRDSHKMHAFVRFRKIETSTGEEHYVAWFEPDHHIVRANAGFFKKRFANMRWSILTPRGCIHWDLNSIRESPPAHKSDAPDSDATEDLWKKYYASIFNPARLKVSAMMSEMPKKFWKNMPEAALIPELIASAQSRESQMVDAGKIGFEKRPATLAELKDRLQSCRQCSIGCSATQSVAGEGAPGSRLMIVGEQPGDQEDIEGRPFVGPAGKLLDVFLGKSGIARADAFVTNAVKHFKYERRGKRRIHQSPTAKEIDTCRWWLESERQIVGPKLILALGASAARSVLGKTVSLQQARGRPVKLDDGSELWITAHPSYLLRLTGDARLEQERLFARDLAAVQERMREVII